MMQICASQDNSSGAFHISGPPRQTGGGFLFWGFMSAEIIQFIPRTEHLVREADPYTAHVLKLEGLALNCKDEDRRLDAVRSLSILAEPNDYIAPPCDCA